MLQGFKIGQCVGSGFTTHLQAGLQRPTKCRPTRIIEQCAAVVGIQLYTTLTSRFTVRHSRYCRTDRRCDAAGAASISAGHCHSCSTFVVQRGRVSKKQASLRKTSNKQRICSPHAGARGKSGETADAKQLIKYNYTSP